MVKDPMQTTVSLSEEHKAVLAAICNVSDPLCGKVKCHTLPQIITGGTELIASRMENSPDFPKATLYVLTVQEESSLQTAIIHDGSSSDEGKGMSLRHVPVPKDKVKYLDQMSEFFDKSWVLCGRGIDDHSFSYEGNEGRAKLLFSHSVEFGLNAIFGRADLGSEIETYSRGKYLVKDAHYLFRMCNIIDEIIIDGNKAYKIKRYDVSIHINDGKVKLGVGNVCDAELCDDSPDKQVRDIHSEVDYDVEYHTERQLPNIDYSDNSFDDQYQFG